MIYEPKNGLVQKIGRRLRRFQSTRFIDCKTDVPVICITFDDFPKSAGEIGAQLLEAHGWRGTYYTSAKLAYKRNHHGLQFDRDDVIRLDRAGHEIAGHTLEHVDLTTLGVTDVMDQIKMNRNVLQSFSLSQTIDNFAYPFGEINSGLKHILGSEFSSLRGIHEHVHYKKADLNELGSFGFYSTTQERVIETVKSLKRKPGWMTIFTHDIQDEPTKWGCTADQFAQLLDAIETSGAQVMTIRQAVAHFGEQNEQS